MTVTLYQSVQGSAVTLPNSSTLIEQLRLPNTGSFVVFGRVIVANTGPTANVITAALTTLDGVTTLDTVTVFVSSITTNANTLCITLQGILQPGLPTQNEIVDIRGSASNGAGTAFSGSLFAISVDQISGPVT